MVQHLSHALLLHLQYATHHGMKCWLEVGVHFTKHGNAFTTIDDVLCRKGR